METTRAETRSLDDIFLERDATLVSVATATISTRQEGFIRSLAAEVGDLVHKGDLIASLDDADRKLQLVELGASLRRARATLSEEERAWQRAEELFHRNIISAGERDDQQASLDRAQAEVDEGVARVERATQDLEQLRIEAPDDGAITQLFTEEGEYLQRGDKIAELKVIRAMIALCTVSERYLSDINEGASVYVHITAYPERVFEGLVWKIVPDAVLQSRSFPVKVLLPNPDLALKPGMSARVSFVRPILNGLLLPKDAILREGDSHYVYVVRAGQAERRDIQLGSALGDQQHVRSGITAEDDVIVTGNEGLTPGSSVRVVELPPPGPPTLPTMKAAEGNSAGS